MFKYIALGFLLSINICCLSSSTVSVEGLRRTASGRFFNGTTRIPAVQYYKFLAAQGNLPWPTEKGGEDFVKKQKASEVVYRIGETIVTEREASIARIILQVEYLANPVSPEEEELRRSFNVWLERAERSELSEERRCAIL